MIINQARVKETNIFRSHYYFCKTNQNGNGVPINLNGIVRYMYREYRGFGRYHFHQHDIKAFLKVEIFLYLNIIIINLDDILKYYLEPNNIKYTLQHINRNQIILNSNGFGSGSDNRVNETVECDVANEERQQYLISKKFKVYKIHSKTYSNELYAKNTTAPIFNVDHLNEEKSTIIFNNIIQRLSIISFIKHIDIKLGNNFSSLTYPILTSLFEEITTEIYTYININLDDKSSHRLRGLLLLITPSYFDFLMHMSIVEYFKSNVNEKIDEDIVNNNRLELKLKKIKKLEKNNINSIKSKEERYNEKLKSCTLSSIRKNENAA